MEPTPAFQTPQEKSPELVATYEPKLLPFIDNGELYTDVEVDYPLEHQDVVEKVSWRHFTTRVDRYFLTTQINALEYYFRLSGKRGSQDPFVLSFKTKEYDYAITSLDEEGTRKLFETMADFLETAFRDKEGKVNTVDISPSDASFTNEQIEDCMAEIIKKHPNYTREELLTKHRGYKIFRLYKELFKTNFSGENFDATSLAYKRSRYFRIQFIRYLKNWEIDNSYKMFSSFVLKRREASTNSSS